MARLITNANPANLKISGSKPKQRLPSRYWDNKENILQFLCGIRQKYKLHSYEDWNSITWEHIKSNGGWQLSSKYSIYELKCMAFPEGKLKFKNPKQAPGYWENKTNILQFLDEIKQKYNVNTPDDWNSITRDHIQSNGGGSLFSKYSIYDLKCMACPEGNSIFKKYSQKQAEYWENKENILQFLDEIKQKYDLNTPDDWNSITKTLIRSNGGSKLLLKYSIFQLQCMACPEGKLIFKNSKSSRFWENKENILQFLEEIKLKYHLNTPDDWNSITREHIKSNGGNTLLSKYSLFELRCMACPEGKLKFNLPKRSHDFWENKENILQFLSQLKLKYNLNSVDDWNSIDLKLIKSNGGSKLLSKYSIYEIKCMACPDGKSKFSKYSQKQAPGFWENKTNILHFLEEIKQKYNLNTPEDWNSITWEHIKSSGGWTLSSKYSIYELKCMACPEGISIFNNPKQPSGYWENKTNILHFLEEIKQKYNVNTPDDWNSITRDHIQTSGGNTLLSKYSLFELKCMACPEGKSIFNNPKQASGYWENRNNVRQFLDEIKEKYNLNTPEDWNKVTINHIQSNRGSTLLTKYSIYELKYIACPEGESSFSKHSQKQVPGYWENEENIHQFLDEIKQKYNLNTSDDWNRISRLQILMNGGWGLFSSKIYPKIKIKFDSANKPPKFVPLSKLILGSVYKRSSQRWLFLQIQKLFPEEEIVEDYFHSDLSRISGANVQFDIFMMNKEIAIEYHGKQHYEDIPTGFANLETYKYRDLEKEKLCAEHGIQLIVIPYWWDNKLDSLRTFLYSKINV